MNKLNPEQLEIIQSTAIHRQASAMAFGHSDPQDVAAATAAILQAAFIMATAGLSAERRAGLFLEDK